MLLPRIDHIPDGLRFLITQYRGKPKLTAYIAIFLNQVQLLEDAIHATVSAWDIETAIGWRLDAIGALVGQARIGETDAIYRAFVKARIRANRSLGRPSDLQTICQLTVGTYTYRESANNVYVHVPTALSEAFSSGLLSLLQLAKPQGVRVWLTWQAGQPLIRASAGASYSDGVFAEIPGGHSSDLSPSYQAGLYAGSRA